MSWWKTLWLLPVLWCSFWVVCPFILLHSFCLNTWQNSVGKFTDNCKIIPPLIVLQRQHNQSLFWATRHAGEFKSNNQTFFCRQFTWLKTVLSRYTLYVQTSVWKSLSCHTQPMLSREQNWFKRKYETHFPLWNTIHQIYYVSDGVRLVLQLSNSLKRKQIKECADQNDLYI